MKKLISFILVFFIAFSVTGCGEKEKTPGEPNHFPIGTDRVNEILTENGLEMYAVPLEFENTLEDTETEFYNIFHSANSTPAGSLSMSSGPDGVASSFNYYAVFDDYNLPDGTVEKVVAAACDAFGNIPDKAVIAQDIIEGVEKRELVAGGETHRYWHGYYDNVYVLALYRYNTLEDIENDVLIFGYVNVMDEAMFRNHLEVNKVQDWASRIYSEYFG